MDENKPKVVIIDDDKDVMDMVQTVLESEGYRLDRIDLIATRVDKDLIRTFLKENDPQIILWNINHQIDWDIYQATAITKEAKGRRIIFTTSMENELKKFMGEGKSVEYLIKPFDIEDLISRVNNETRKENELNPPVGY